MVFLRSYEAKYGKHLLISCVNSSTHSISTRWNCSGAEEKRNNAPEQYSELLKRIDNNECNRITASDIDKDVNRTFSTKIVSLDYRRPSQVLPYSFTVSPFIYSLIDSMWCHLD